MILFKHCSDDTLLPLQEEEAIEDGMIVEIILQGGHICLSVCLDVCVSGWLCVCLSVVHLYLTVYSLYMKKGGYEGGNKGRRRIQ